MTMGTLFSYTLGAGIFLMSGYIAYRTLLSDEKQPGLNRIILLMLYTVSLAACPLLAIYASHTSAALPAANVVATGTQPLLVPVEQPTASHLLPQTALWIYAIGMAATALRTLYGMWQLAVIVARGRKEPREDYTLVLLDKCDIPFSFMHYVVMSEADAARAGAMITAHELGHLRRRHWLDLLLAQTVCVLMWYNPAAWLLRAELRRVHEYQADIAVLDGGFDARSYQMLLIEKAAGVRLQSLANSLNHSNLSKRITMMYKQNNRAFRRMRVLALVPAMLLAAMAMRQPAVAATLADAGAATMQRTQQPQTDAKPASTVKGTEKSVSAQGAPTKLPEYPGGEQELLRYLTNAIHYPAEAMKAGTQGRVVVSFVVAADGSITDVKVMKSVSTALDAEAMRVVREMPRWTPATDADGNYVACSFALPVQFKTESGQKTKQTEAKPKQIISDIVVVGYGTETLEIRTDSASNHVSIIKGKADKKNASPAYFINGKPFEGSISDLDKDKIQSITVRKDDPDYPDGIIDIQLK